MQCLDFRTLAESYLGDELLIETNHDVILHLEACAECRRELAARCELRNTLRLGFERAPELQMSAGFADELHTKLRNSALRPAPAQVIRRVAYIALAACLAIGFALGFKALLQRMRVQSQSAAKHSNSADANAGRFTQAALVRNAIGDHRDCALNHRLHEAPVSLDEAGQKYDKSYIRLVNAVISDGSLPAGVELIEGHSCIFNGQRFGHIILRYHDQVVSVLLTNIDAPEQAGATGSETIIASAQIEGFQLAKFETGRHVVFVVSSLSEVDNMSVAHAIAPAMLKHVGLAESTI